VSFVAIVLCVAPQRAFIGVRVHFVIESVRKLLDTPLQIDIDPEQWKESIIVPIHKKGDKIDYNKY
jgi:hypothetical protein